MSIPIEDLRMRIAKVPTLVTEAIKPENLFETEFTKYITAKNWTTLILSGGVGSGKTVAACLRMQRFFNENPYNGHGPLGMFIDASDFARVSRYDQDEVDKLACVPFLLIDDLGTEFNDVNGNFVCGLIDIVTKRCRERRHTVMTTNLNRAEFIQRYDARLVDRVTESGAFCSGVGKSLRKAPPSGFSDRIISSS